MPKCTVWFTAVALIWVCASGTASPAGAASASLAASDSPIIIGDPNLVLPERPVHPATDIIVKFRPDVDSQSRDAILNKHRCSISRTSQHANLHRVSIPSDRTPEEMVELLQAEGAVEYAELNPYASIYFVPNDPYYHYQWNLDNTVTGGIHMQAAWDIEMGDPNVIIAVVDTGVAYENYGRFARAPDLAETSFVPGYNFINDSNHANDDQGHGTHVTGTLAQSTGNDLGVAGVAFRCSIMPVKVLDANGEGDEFTIAQGIYFAADHGAKVMNMSFGSSRGSTTMENALAYAYQKGVTLVCAAGNDYQHRNPPSYPAAYDAYCIAVAATRFDGTRAYYSTTGSYVDIAAPGGDMTVDQNGDGYPDGIVQQTFSRDPNQFAYYFFEGTSMATPHVSGVAALLVSKGVTDPNSVRQAIEMTATDMGTPGWDPQYGYGIVNAYAALTYRPPSQGISRN